MKGIKVAPALNLLTMPTSLGYKCWTSHAMDLSAYTSGTCWVNANVMSGWLLAHHIIVTP